MPVPLELVHKLEFTLSGPEITVSFTAEIVSGWHKVAMIPPVTLQMLKLRFEGEIGVPLMVPVVGSNVKPKGRVPARPKV